MNGLFFYRLEAWDSKLKYDMSMTMDNMEELIEDSNLRDRVISLTEELMVLDKNFK